METGFVMPQHWMHWPRRAWCLKPPIATFHFARRHEIPTYAHYLRAGGYQTALSGKMHFIGPDQYHGFEKRLTADLYPADFAWVPNWEHEGKRPRRAHRRGVSQVRPD